MFYACLAHKVVERTPNITVELAQCQLSTLMSRSIEWRRDNQYIQQMHSIFGCLADDWIGSISFLFFSIASFDYFGFTWYGLLFSFLHRSHSFLRCPKSPSSKHHQNSILVIEKPLDATKLFPIFFFFLLHFSIHDDWCIVGVDRCFISFRCKWHPINIQIQWKFGRKSHKINLFDHKFDLGKYFCLHVKYIWIPSKFSKHWLDRHTWGLKWWLKQRQNRLL